MIDPAGIPQITGDTDALAGHATAVAGVGTDFADTGQRVDSTWQELAAVYEAPEAAQLFAATAPVRTVSASVGEDLATVGSALSTYATTVAGIKTRLEALRADATAFVGSVSGDDDWRSDEGRVNEHNQLLTDVNAAVADFTDAQRTCANTILALYTDRRWVADDGDGEVGENEFGYSAEMLDAAVGEDGALPWGDAEEHDRGFFGDVGAFFGGIGQGAVDMVVGLGALIGYAEGDWSWSTAGTAWAGLGIFAGSLVVYSNPALIAMDQTSGLFGQERGFFGGTLTNAGKALIAYDTWGEDPQRAAGMTVFNVVSAVIGTKGAGAGLRGAGAAAQGSRFATVVRVGNGLSRTGEFLGRIPTVTDLAASVRNRFPSLHVPPIDIPDVDVPTPHVDTPRVDLPEPARVDLPDGPSIDDTVRVGDTPFRTDTVDTPVRTDDGAPTVGDRNGPGAESSAVRPDVTDPAPVRDTSDTPGSPEAPGTPDAPEVRSSTDVPEPVGAPDPVDAPSSVDAPDPVDAPGSPDLPATPDVPATPDTAPVGTLPDGSWIGREHGTVLELDAPTNTLADDALARATTAERSITPQITEIVDGVPGARTQGLEFVLKSEESLKRKLATDLLEDANLSPTDAVAGVRDSVRYTMEIPEGNYSAGVRQAVDDLQARGFESVTFKPTWEDPTAYRGLNSTWRDPATGQVFELQFHTPESFAAKMQTHELYEAARVPGVPADEIARIQAQQAEIFSRVPTPVGAGDLLELRRTLGASRPVPALVGAVDGPGAVAQQADAVPSRSTVPLDTPVHDRYDGGHGGGDAAPGSADSGSGGSAGGDVGGTSAGGAGDLPPSAPDAPSGPDPFHDLPPAERERLIDEAVADSNSKFPLTRENAEAVLSGGPPGTTPTVIGEGVQGADIQFVDAHGDVVLRRENKSIAGGFNSFSSHVDRAANKQLIDVDGTARGELWVQVRSDIDVDVESWIRRWQGVPGRDLSRYGEVSVVFRDSDGNALGSYRLSERLPRR